MNDRQRKMLDLIDRAKKNERKAGGSVLVTKDLDRMARTIEAESALSSPSCDFASSETASTPPVHYLALFVDKECLERAVGSIDRSQGSLDKKAIDSPHVTLAYKPLSSEVPRELFGKEFTLVIDGYGYDAENEGLSVKLQPDVGAADFDKESFETVQKILDDRGVKPHITLSVSKDGKAVNTKNLRFDPVEPISIGCVLGAHVKFPQVEFAAEQTKNAEEAKKESSKPSTEAAEKYRMRRQRLDDLLASISDGASLDDGADRGGLEDDGPML